MDRKRNPIFPELSPPPGGLGELRRRMQQPLGPFGKDRRIRVLVSTGAAVTVCLLMWPVLKGTLNTGRMDPAARMPALLQAGFNPALVRLGLADPPSEAVTVPREERRRAAVEKVAVSNPEVIYYRIEVVDGD